MDLSAAAGKPFQPSDLTPRRRRRKIEAHSPPESPINIVNFYGAPASGRSTHAAGVAFTLARMGLRAEILRVRGIGSLSTPTSDLDGLIDEQARLEFADFAQAKARMEADGVDWVLVEDPPLDWLRLLSPGSLVALEALELHRSYEAIDVRLALPTLSVGSFSDAAREIDDRISEILFEHCPDHLVISSGSAGPGFVREIVDAFMAKRARAEQAAIEAALPPLAGIANLRKLRI